MTFHKTSLLNAIMLVALLASHASASDQAVLKTDKDKVNYAIGVNIVNNLAQQGVEFDLDLVMQGMRDARSGGKLLLSDEEVRNAVSQFQLAVRQRQALRRANAAEENKRAGEAFLAENRTEEGVVTLPSGLQYRVLRSGQGGKPTDADTVECNYRGRLINGTEIESSYREGKPAALKVAGMMPGLREAVKLMPAGSVWRLFVPSLLAYGPQGKAGSVGPNEALIYDLELAAIK